MEDTYALNYQTSATDNTDLSFVYMAIFDGHGGDMAANYARDHLLDNIIRQRAFWVTDNDNQVLQAISKGFLQTHYDMMKEVGKDSTLTKIYFNTFLKTFFLALAL
jgi:protein phosphatase 1D